MRKYDSAELALDNLSDDDELLVPHLVDDESLHDASESVVGDSLPQFVDDEVHGDGDETPKGFPDEGIHGSGFEPAAENSVVTPIAAGLAVRPFVGPDEFDLDDSLGLDLAL